MNETKIENIALDRVRPSKTNPRKHFDEAYIAELGDSIRLKGIIQPLTVRPGWCMGKTDEEISDFGNRIPESGNGVADFFEIVAGECRYRGAMVAKLEGVPSIVRALSDREALEIQLIENIQRKDITPVEEAEAYRRLMEMGHTVETIHQRTGLDRSTIYGKLKVIRAPDFLLEALAKGIVGGRVCELVGRIPVPEMRVSAAHAILEPGLFMEADGGGLEVTDQPMSYRVAADFVSRNFMRALSGAPFEQKDETLVAPIHEEGTGERIGGGACTDCPMRSGNSPQRNGEMKRPDICMNPKCFAAKCDVHFTRLQENALAEGKKLLSDAETKEMFQADGSLRFDSPYVLLSQQPGRSEVREDVKKIPSWKKLIEAVESKPQIAVGRDPRGRIVELVDHSLAIEAVNLAAKQRGEKSIFERGAKSASAQGSGATLGSASSEEVEPEWKKQERRNREIKKQEFQVTLASMEALSGLMERKTLSGPDFFDALIELAADHASHDGCWLVCKRLGLDPKAKNPHSKREGVQGAVIEYGLTLAPVESKLPFVIELLLAQQVRFVGVRQSEHFGRFAKLYKLDVGEIEKRVRTAGKEKKKKAPSSKSQVPEKLQALNSNGTSLAAPPAEHEFEHIVQNKYRCKGCGAPAVKQGKKLVVAKQFRGKPCSQSEALVLPPALPDPKKLREKIAKKPKKAPSVPVRRKGVRKSE